MAFSTTRQRLDRGGPRVPATAGAVEKTPLETPRSDAPQVTQVLAITTVAEEVANNARCARQRRLRQKARQRLLQSSGYCRFFCGFLRPLSSDSRGPTAATTILRRLSLMRTGSAVACTTSLMGRQAPRQCKHTSNCGHKIVRDRRLFCSRIRGRRRLHSDTVPR